MAERPSNIHQHGPGGIRPPAPILLQSAYSVLPVIRAPLGYDLVHPRKSLVWALLMALGGVALCAISPQATIGAQWYFWFIAYAFAIACIRFSRRARGQKRGEQIHTQEAGYSVITRLFSFLPAAFTEQLLTPLALGALGWFLCHAPVVYWGEWQGRYYYEPVSVLLGWWLVIAACSYLLLARWEYSTRWSQQRALVDRMHEAKIFGDRLSAHEEAARRPAGSGKNRRSKSANAAPDYGQPDMADLG